MLHLFGNQRGWGRDHSQEARNTETFQSPTAPRHYHYILGIKVVTEGAIIKVDFIEGLGGESDHLALVEAPVLVLANDFLAGRDAQQGPLSTLEETAWVTQTALTGLISSP